MEETDHGRNTADQQRRRPRADAVHARHLRRLRRRRRRRRPRRHQQRRRQRPLGRDYLAASGALAGPDGVRRALFAYNHADWYVGDVLFYAHAYGGGQVLAGTQRLRPRHRRRQPRPPPLTTTASSSSSPGPKASSVAATSWARTGRTPTDCSSIHPSRVRPDRHHHAPHRPGTTRLARRRQRLPVPLGAEQPGDLIFIDSYLGPNHRPRRHRLEPRRPADHRSRQQRPGHHPRQLHRLGGPSHLRDVLSTLARANRVSKLILTRPAVLKLAGHDPVSWSIATWGVRRPQSATGGGS